MPSLLSYLVRKAVFYTALFFSAVTLAFAIIHLAPGDPTYVLAGDVNDEDFIRSVRERFGLDKPLYEQLLIYFYNVLRGDLGYSYFRSEPVSSLILSRVPATMLLVLTSMTMASVLGILLGFIAVFARGPLDAIISTISLVGISVPYFWLGMIMLLIFAVWLDIFPLGGMISIRESFQGIRFYLDILHHLFLPAATLAIFNIAYVTKMTRNNLVDELVKDYISALRAVGFAERKVMRAALRNVLIPIVTFIGFNTGVLLTGAIVTETIFSWPGMGSLLFSSIKLRDYPVVVGIFIYSSLIIITISFVMDLVYMYLDPRIKRG